MKKIILTSTFLFLSLLINAQELDGVWKFEKMNFRGTMIYFDNTVKDKENLINAYLEVVKYGLATDEEKKESIKGINENKSAIYVSFKEQYSYTIKFKDKKLFYKFMNNEGKMEETEAELNQYYNNAPDVLQLYSPNYLYDIFSFKYLITGNKLKLTEINEMAITEEDVFVFYYKK